jgi:hypothetical protein
MIPAAAGLLLLAAAFVASQAGWSSPLGAIGLLGFALTIVATTTIGHTIAFRCSTCRGNLAPLAFAYPSWRFNPRVRFCPYCAADLDAEPTATSELIAAEPVRIADRGGVE